MSRVIDLSAHGRGRGPSEPIRHPAGVILPFEGPSDAALIIPELRSEIRAGAYDADMIALLDAAVRPGDRVLVIGAGLGVISTLIARREGVERVIAVEANTALIPYLERTHALNDAERVETINAVLAEGKKGRVPFFARRDLRNSSLLPHDRSWQQVMMVPYMDLNLILTEERITLVVSDIPTASASLLARAELGPVERILLNYADDPSGAWEDEGVCARLVARGYVPEAAGTAVLLRRADLLRAPGDKDATAGEGRPEDGRSEEGRPKEALPEIGEDTDEDDADGDRAVDASGVESPAEAGGGRAPSPSATGPVAGPPGEAGPEAAPHGGPHASPSATPEIPPQSPPRAAREAPRDVAGPELPPTPDEPLGTARGAGGVETPPGGDGREARAPRGAAEPERERRRRLWGPVAVALALALPLMLIGQLAGERGSARMAAMEQIGAAWGGPQTLTGPFLVVPVQGADGAAAEPLVILPQSLEAATALVTDGGRAGTRGAPAGREYGALVYRSRSEVRLVADAASAAALVAPGETALWQQSRLALGISEPNALGAAYFLGGTAQAGPARGAAGGTAGDAGFVAGTGAGALPGIQAAVGDPRDGGPGWRFVVELDGWRLLRLTPAGGTTSWRMHGDWPHPAFRGPFRPALEETGERGFIAHWQVPEAAVALPRAFRGTGPLAGLDALAIGVELVPPLDLYRTIERGAKLGLLVIALTFGAVLLLERSAGRNGRVVHYALIGAAQCAFFLLLLPLAERLGFQAAYAIAAAATTVLLTVYAWSPLGLGSRAGWVALALAALYGVMYPILAAREHTLMMGAVLAFLVVAALMWATRGEGRDEGGNEGRTTRDGGG